MKTIQEVSLETLKLENLFKGATAGEQFTYNQIEALTGVKMNNKGKSSMRSALRRLKMPYETISGTGIKLLSSDNAMRIVTDKVVRIDNSVKRAEKTVRQVSEKTYKDLNPKEQNTINTLTAFFGSIRVFSNSAKQLFKKEPLQVSK